MSVTGIVAALTAEARVLAPSAAGRFIIHTLRDGNLLIISGMGPQAATQAALSLVAAGARGLLSFGLAGALDPGLQAGAILLPETVMDTTGRSYPTDAPWRQQLAARSGTAHHGGALLSLAQPLTSAQDKTQAWIRTGAGGVDMESFAIASVALHAGIDFAIARVVVDTARDSLPGSVLRATDVRGEVDVPRLVAGVLWHPVQILALLRLAHRYREAMAALRRLGQQGVGRS